MRIKPVFFHLLVLVLFYGCMSVKLPRTDSGILKKKPEFYNLEWKKSETLTRKKTDLTIEVDSVGKLPLSILVNADNLPILYTANIETPVCADGECKFMHIKMYWSLLGNYVGFDRFPNLPLTKHDHDPFIRKDYQKLHTLLSDRNSILERRKIDELVKSPEELKKEGVDALSGATITEVKESVVSGALYSCYVAWHLAHGEVQKTLRNYTSEIGKPELWSAMLYSNNSDYQLFALQNMDEVQYKNNYDQISVVFEMGTPLLRTFIVKSLPASFWNSPSLQQPYWNKFSQIDINTRSFLLQKLKSSSQTVIQDLSSELEVMTRNQLKMYLSKLPMDVKGNSVLMGNLHIYAKNNSYGYIVKEYLEDL